MTAGAESRQWRDGAWVGDEYLATDVVARFMTETLDSATINRLAKSGEIRTRKVDGRLEIEVASLREYCRKRDLPMQNFHHR